MTRSSDKMDQALQGLLGSISEDEQPPIELVTRVRQAIHDRQIKVRASGQADLSSKRSRQGGSQLMSLAISLGFMVATGWGLAFHRQLLSEPAGRQRSPDGTQAVFYSDGRVERATEADG